MGEREGEGREREREKKRERLILSGAYSAGLFKNLEFIHENSIA